MHTIEMKKITAFGGFNPEEFCVTPEHWFLDTQNVHGAESLLREAEEMAKSVDGICIAIIHSPAGNSALGESCNSGLSSKFILFNADECCRAEAEVRAVTFTGLGAFTPYWNDHFIKYCPGHQL